MGRRIYTYKCSHCDNTFDEYTELVEQHECPQCGSTADRIITCPQIKLEGITGSFPGAYHAWEKKRNQKIAQEQKYSS